MRKEKELIQTFLYMSLATQMSYFTATWNWMEREELVNKSH
jgi:hypothetical protein